MAPRTVQDMPDCLSREPITVLWWTGRSRTIASGLHRVALRKLAQLHFAAVLEDLRMPPGNRLEALKGDSARTA